MKDYNAFSLDEVKFTNGQLESATQSTVVGYVDNSCRLRGQL